MCLKIEDRKKKELHGLNSPHHFTENLNYKGVGLLVFNALFYTKHF